MKGVGEKNIIWGAVVLKRECLEKTFFKKEILNTEHD